MEDVRLNDDFFERVVIETDRAPWIASPAAGVERKMLDRIGGEVARATSVVRYAPGSAFDAHEHTLGEEFLVLEGVFADESGEYPAGTYVRNPPGSSHSPRAPGGCTILVKLRQMGPWERERVVVDTRAGAWRRGIGPGHSVQVLHAPQDGSEFVALEKLTAGTKLPELAQEGGEELFVVEGVLADEAGRYPARTWIRNPPGHRRALHAPMGTTFWCKRGHLATPR